MESHKILFIRNFYPVPCLKFTKCTADLCLVSTSFERHWLARFTWKHLFSVSYPLRWYFHIFFVRIDLISTSKCLNSKPGSPSSRLLLGVKFSSAVLLVPLNVCCKRIYVGLRKRFEGDAFFKSSLLPPEEEFCRCLYSTVREQLK